MRLCLKKRLSAQKKNFFWCFLFFDWEKKNKIFTLHITILSSQKTKSNWINIAETSSYILLCLGYVS